MTNIEFKEFLWALLKETSFRDYCEVPFKETLTRPRYIWINESLERIKSALIDKLGITLND